MPDTPHPPFRPATPGLPPPARRPDNLTLPRRTPGPPPSSLTGGMISLAYADMQPEQHRKVENRINSRSPFPGAKLPPPPATQTAERAKLEELEKALRLFETELTEREAALVELQSRLGEREREIAETENLLRVRESLLKVQRKASTMPPFAASAEERHALEKLRATLDAQEATLVEAKAALREREAFVEQSETTLMDKVASQQEHEIMLEQRYEDLRRAEQDLRRRLAVVDPAVAAELEAERVKKRDEFNE